MREAHSSLQNEKNAAQVRGSTAALAALVHMDRIGTTLLLLKGSRGLVDCVAVCGACYQHQRVRLLRVQGTWESDSHSGLSQILVPRSPLRSYIDLASIDTRFVPKKRLDTPSYAKKQTYPQFSRVHSSIHLPERERELNEFPFLKRLPRIWFR